MVDLAAPDAALLALRHGTRAEHERIEQILRLTEPMALPRYAAIVAGASYRVIPWQMAIVAKLMRAMPNALFDRVLAGRPRKHRKGES